MKYSNVLLFILISFVLSCGGVSDYTENLGNGFYFASRGSKVKSIFGPNVNPRKEIYSKVIEYAFDKDFILVAQEPLWDMHIRSIIISLDEEKSDYQKLEEKADSILRNDPFYQSVFSRKINFWIISHKADSLFGPFSLEDYLIKKEELEVPKGLKLKLALGV